MSKPMPQVFSYLRVSGDAQADADKDGFPRQQAAIAAFAKKKYVIKEEFRDEGVSGTNELDDRDGLSALLQAIAGNGVRIVIVENATRLARDLMVQEAILAKFRDLGVAVLGADGMDLTVADNDPTRILIRQIMGAFAQFEKSMLVAKLRSGRIRKKKETGRCEGILPFGSNEAEATTLARMKALQEQRKPSLSLAEVAEKLNKEGCTNRSGGAWTKAMVHKLLSK